MKQYEVGGRAKIGDIVYIPAKVVERELNSTVLIVELPGRAMLHRPDGAGIRVVQVDPQRMPMFLEDCIQEVKA